MFTPCSKKHGKFCSQAHSELVSGYRAERQRQELLLEGLRGGDLKYIDFYVKEDLITFKTWLSATRQRRQ